MNYNILAYGIYGSLTIYIIYRVGKLFHTNGRVFILRLFRNQAATTDTTNNLLLIAYYLFNIGYAILQFSFWQPVTNTATLLASITHKTGLLLAILALTHYFNMLLIYLLSQKQTNIP